MPFKKGVRLPNQGGWKPRAGRKSKEKKEIHEEAEALAREYIENHIKPVLETYGKVCQGYIVKKTLTTKSGDSIEFEEFVYDTQILKHYMDRVIPPRAPEDKQGKAQPGYYVIE